MNGGTLQLQSDLLVAATIVSRYSLEGFLDMKRCRTPDLPTCRPGLGPKRPHLNALPGGVERSHPEYVSIRSDKGRLPASKTLTIKTKSNSPIVEGVQGKSSEVKDN